MIVTAVINAHREGVLAGPSLRSFQESADFAEKHGLEVEKIAVLDRPDRNTAAMFETTAARGISICHVSTGDPGQARNRGVAAASGEYIAFLDADDLWCDNWLVDALAFCTASESDVIAHSEVNLTFGAGRGLWRHVDSAKAGFDPAFLRVGNYWDALTFAKRSIYEKFPFRPNDLPSGYGHEDWNWNCVTLAAGVAHRPVPGTVHFKRRRNNSQMSRCEKNDVVVWPNPLTAYHLRKHAFVVK